MTPLSSESFDALCQPLLDMIDLLNQDRLAMEANDTVRVEDLAVAKNQLCVILNDHFSTYDLTQLSAEQQTELKKRVEEMEQAATVNALIAKGALEQITHKMHWIHQQAAHSYGPDGKHQAAARGSLAAKA